MKGFIAGLALLLMSASAVAAPPPCLEVGGEISGLYSGLKLRVDFKPSCWTGSFGQFFVIALLPDGKTFLVKVPVTQENPYGWTVWTGGEIPSAASGTIGPMSVQIFDGSLNLLPFPGMYIFAGVGPDANSMLVNGSYTLFYTVGDVIPMGIKLTSFGQVPPGCDWWDDPCVSVALASGEIKLVETTATMTGTASAGRPVVFAAFRNSVCAFGVCGYWNVVPIYANVASIGTGLGGGSGSRYNYVVGNESGAIVQHEAGQCQQVKWWPPSPTPPSNAWQAVGTISCQQQ